MKTVTIKRADLIQKISINRMTDWQVSKVLNKTIEEIEKALASGEDVKITSFGTFGVVHKKERFGRNPRTGKDAKISARRVISFRACRDFKKLVADFKP